MNTGFQSENRLDSGEPSQVSQLGGGGHPPSDSRLEVRYALGRAHLASAGAHTLCGIKARGVVPERALPRCVWCYVELRRRNAKKIEWATRRVG